MAGGMERYGDWKNSADAGSMGWIMRQKSLGRGTGRHAVDLMKVLPDNHSRDFPETGLARYGGLGLLSPVPLI